MIQNKLKNVEIKWLRLDEFTNKKMKEYIYEIDNYESKAAGIEEEEVIGI